MNFIFQVPLTNLKPDFYEFSMRLFNHAGMNIDTKSSQFMISPFKDISRPTEIYNQVSLANTFYFDYILGLQFHNIGEQQKAVSYLEKSILANPGFNEGRIAFLKTGLELKNFSRVLEDVDKLKNDERFAFRYHRIKGEALFGLKKYKEALGEFLEANKINNSDVSLINMMGETFLKLEDFQQALKAFEASIQLNDKQPVVLQTIKKLKTEISKNK
jgi:tetratricopeptide (TPR) repeat protein